MAGASRFCGVEMRRNARKALTHGPFPLIDGFDSGFATNVEYKLANCPASFDDTEEHKPELHVARLIVLALR